jgi:protocatechuate 3,4-dioxygenase beta subunit
MVTMKKIIFVIQLLLFMNIVIAGNLKGDVQKKETISDKMGTFILMGKVTDDSTGEALTGVKVTVEGVGVSTYTDFDGNYAFPNLTPGEYRVTASLVSYRKGEVVKVEHIKSDQKLNIKLHALK